ncbi:MAG TPA: efflux RND transporter permease subunit [Candidatus Polarisedimenticolia bacterium]|nr:efflux RND transporter permease subunit [Candidatus Polarisedimenticolia bacterium]
MNLIQGSIRYPVSTAVGVILLVLFGAIALFRLPVQLTPDVEEPKVTITTLWPGASPHEVEREIVDEQEEQLKSLEGLIKMESSSSDSAGTITLTFPPGTDLDAALLKVNNRLEQVPSYPGDAEKPVIRSVDQNASAIAWFILAPTPEKGFEGDISTMFDFVDDQVKPEFERVPGVAASNVFGGREHELHVIVDPAKLAAHRITLSELGQAIERENRNHSGGDFDEGKRRYVVRTIGEYGSPEDVEAIVVAVRNGVPVYLRDVARAELGFEKPGAKVFAQGRQVMAMNAIRETGANVLDTMEALKARVDRINAQLLEPRGLRLYQAYDETEYIRSAIGLLRENLYQGGLLAVLVLLLFLRSWNSTFIVTLSIPLSVIGAFLVMSWFGRTLNVISLAGMAFGVGMSVDNTIVILENIYRHRQLGKPRFQAAYEGTVEVWGAVLLATLVNVAVFVPVVFIEQEAGQLFGDIAVALSCSALFSLLVSITVVPALAAKILHPAEEDASRRGFHNLWGLAGTAARLNVWMTESVDWINATTLRRVGTIVVLAAVPLGLSWMLIPQREYLPVGNQNFLFGILLPPPGYSLDEVTSAHDIYKEAAAPLSRHPAGSPEAEALPGGGLQRFFFVALNNMAFMGARANDPERVTELLPEFQKANAKIPGSIGFINQASIFQRGIGQGRSVDIEISGPDLPELIARGAEVFMKVNEVLPGAQARPIPSLDLGNPELHVVTDRRRAAELGVSNRELGFAVNALVDGAKVSDYRNQGREIDLVVKGDNGSFAYRTHLLEQMPIATAGGELVTLGSVAELSVESGPVEIRRRERQRTITIQVSPPQNVPMQAAMDTINASILDPMRASGRLGGLYQVYLSGSADKLEQTGRALFWNFILAVIITYLLMAVLFEGFLYPFVIMFSVPLAGLGGILGLAAVNAFIAYQPMDVLTMLGFIILVGTVVNNAILIVHQSLIHMKEDGMNPRDAIREATGTRIRPIFMSVAASVIGMLPLVLFPGAGSELYRGLGSVVLGGLVLSTVFTIFVVPAMFSLSLDIRRAIVQAAKAAVRRPPAPRPAGTD